MAKKNAAKPTPVVEPKPAPAPPVAVVPVAPEPTPDVGGIVITERGYRDSCLGSVLQLKIFRPGYTPLTWGEVWRKFSQAYPGKWAVQMFPPADRLVDGKDVYHLFVLDQEPAGLDLR